MKKRYLLIIAVLLVCMLAGCAGKDAADTTHTSTDAQEEAERVEQWIANEMIFESSCDYDTPVYAVEMDVTFTNRDTGTVLTVPAFWNGGREWVVRYALTELGSWSYESLCTDTTNTGLHGKSGRLRCEEYSGELDIYKHGWVYVKEGMRTLAYADGTPFFYLGDTHWTLPVEEMDGIGAISEERAAQYGITSQFKYIMDHRAKQGYTVIQSEPLSWYVGKTGNSWFGDENGSIYNYGVNDAMLAKFKELDRKFAYIAELGFVHANSQLSYPEELIENYLSGAVDDEKLEKLVRYWIARYSAYPVLWTVTQEGDNDFYGWGGCTVENNPWLKVMDYIDKHDPYGHPLSCHQENTGETIVSNSVFGKKEAHDWYAAQFTISEKNGSKPNFNMLKEYWNNPGAKPVVNYEGHYDHYWASTYKARVQGWASYLNGVFGYGYGVQPIWSIVWADYGEHTVTSDSREEYDRGIDWVDGLYSDCGEQLIYMKDFITQYEWWKLTPCFSGSKYFTTSIKNFSVATIDNDVYLGYFWGSSAEGTSLGVLRGMKNGEYKLTWLNCRTGEKKTENITVSNTIYNIPGKPDTGDWALAAQYIG